MIKKLSLFNFQSHRKSVLELEEGINLIVGASDSGKTSIIRALRWLMFNKPLGDSFRSNWGGDTECEIVLDNETVLIRGRTEKDNFYKLNDEEFKAFKNDVPDIIQKILNVDFINLQTQFEGPFLLSLSSGEVASYFNRIVNLDVIDSSISNINKWMLKESRELEYEQERKKKLEEELKDYDYLEEVEQKVLQMERLEKRLNDKISEYAGLEGVLNNLGIIDYEISELEPLRKLEELVVSLVELKKEYMEIDGCLEKLETLKKSIIWLEIKIKKDEDMFYKEFPEQCFICGAIVKK